MTMGTPWSSRLGLLSHYSLLLVESVADELLLLYKESRTVEMVSASAV